MTGISEGFSLQPHEELLIRLMIHRDLYHVVSPLVFALLLLGSLLELCGLHVGDHLLEDGVPGHQLLPPVRLPRHVAGRVPAPANHAVTNLTRVDREVIILELETRKQIPM